MAVRICILVAATTFTFAYCYGRNYVISAWNKCHEASHVVLYNKRIDKCTWECAVRDSCVAVQYNRMEHSCGILTSKQLETPIQTCPRFVFIRRTHIKESESCGPYKPSLVDNSCITECILPENLQVYATVNQFPSAGSRIKLGCNPPLALIGDQYLQCTKMGEFNSTAPVCKLPEGTNLALQRPACQSTTVEFPNNDAKASLAVDGNTASHFYDDSCTHTYPASNAVERPWWIVDLGFPYLIKAITVYNRQDCCAGRFTDVYVYVSTKNDLSNDQLSGTLCIGDVGPFRVPVITLRCLQNVVGRYVKIILDNSTNPLTLCEVQIHGDLIEGISDVSNS